MYIYNLCSFIYLFSLPTQSDNNKLFFMYLLAVLAVEAKGEIFTLNNLPIHKLTCLSDYNKRLIKASREKCCIVIIIKIIAYWTFQSYVYTA